MLNRCGYDSVLITSETFPYSCNNSTQDRIYINVSVLIYNVVFRNIYLVIHELELIYRKHENEKLRFNILCDIGCELLFLIAVHFHGFGKSIYCKLAAMS